MSDNRYNDYGVMVYVAWMGSLALSCVVYSTEGKLALFFLPLAWLYLSEQSRLSWICSLSYRVWVLGVVFGFGFLNVLKLTTSQHMSAALNNAGAVCSVIAIIVISVIWSTHLRQRLNAKIDERV